MKKRNFRVIARGITVFLGLTCLRGINIKAVDEVRVTGIIASTYISDQGQMVDYFEINLDDIKKVEGVKAEDFDITNNYDGYPLNSKAELVLENYVDDGISLSMSGNTIKMDIKDFKYDSSLTGVFNTISTKYPKLSFTSKDVTKVNTKTVDEFEKLTFTGSNGVTIPYRLKSANTGKAEPLVIWMHGAGEVGTDNVKPITGNRGAVAFAESGKTTNVLAAQYPYKFSVELTDIELKDMKDYFNAYEELINKLVDEGKVDSNRIYLTGASMGGGLTLRFLLEKPKLFAASVAIASRGTVKDLTELEAISDLPIWLFHAEEDTTNISSISKNIYDKLKEIGNDKAKLTIYTTEYMNSLKLYGGLLHWAWVPTLNNNEMINWLYSQSKEVAVTPIDNSTPSQTIINKVSDKDGINKITVNNPNLTEGIKVEITDIKSVEEGKGSFEILAEDNTIRLPFSAIDDNLLTEGSKIVFEFNTDETTDLTNNIQGLKKVFNFNLSVVNGTSITKIHLFNEGLAEITITLNYKEMKSLNKGKILAFYYNEDTKKFEALETKVEGNNVIFKTSHFSQFIIADATPDSQIVPKTGDVAVIGTLILVMIFACAGLVLTRRKSKS